MMTPPMRADDAEIENAILRLLDEVGPERTVGPADAARALIVGPDWHRVMHPVRRAAVRLALDGRIVIYRKGKPVDPNDFKGVYRLGLPRHD